MGILEVFLIHIIFDVDQSEKAENFHRNLGVVQSSQTLCALRVLAVQKIVLGRFTQFNSEGQRSAFNRGLPSSIQNDSGAHLTGVQHKKRNA